jgi:hypothetical protein
VSKSQILESIRPAASLARDLYNESDLATIQALIEDRDSRWAIYRMELERELEAIKFDMGETERELSARLFRANEQIRGMRQEHLADQADGG